MSTVLQQTTTSIAKYNSSAATSFGKNCVQTFIKTVEENCLATNMSISQHRKLTHIKHLLHAKECEGPEDLPDGEVRQCSLSHCRTMKHVLQHLKTCKDGFYCSVPLCFSSHGIISCWMSCFAGDCTVCNHSMKDGITSCSKQIRGFIERLRDMRRTKLNRQRRKSRLQSENLRRGINMDSFDMTEIRRALPSVERGQRRNLCEKNRFFRCYDNFNIQYVKIPSSPANAC